MRGFCKCDLCGGVYRKDDNEIYDGITVWWNDCTDTKCFPEDGKTLTYVVKYDENQKMNTIKFSFDFATEPTKATSTEIDNMLYYIIGGSALIVIILVVVIISIVKGKNKKVHIDEIKQEEIILKKKLLVLYSYFLTFLSKN